MRGFADLDRGEVLRAIQASFVPSCTVNWRNMLAWLTGYDARRLSTYHRQSRRIPHSIRVIPRSQYKADLPRTVAAIGTSSSMQCSHLERIRRQLEALMPLTAITVVQCVKQIQDTCRLKRPLESITGRSGTDLRPPFGESVLQTHKP